jgi:hypothetical protein
MQKVADTSSPPLNSPKACTSSARAITSRRSIIMPIASTSNGAYQSWRKRRGVSVGIQRITWPGIAR